MVKKNNPPIPALHDLSPGSARLCLDVEAFYRHWLGLGPGARLLAALSAGADSTALTCILHILAPRLQLRIAAVTIDHGLRREAALDVRCAQDLCKRLGIVCACRHADVAGLAAVRGRGLEEAGRHARYILLERERQAQGAAFVALGHHAADLSEDVLLRLTRGAGWPSLGGMAARDDARRLLRPLLFVQPDKLKALLQECGVSWREDASNQEQRFRRNRFRHKILPLLRQENPNFDAQVRSLWKIARCDQDYWESELDKALTAHPWQTEESGETLLLPRDLLRPLHQALRLRLYLKAVRHLHGQGESGGQGRAATFLAMDRALQEGRGNKRFQLPGNLEAHLRRGEILFSRNYPRSVAIHENV